VVSIAIPVPHWPFRLALHFVQWGQAPGLSAENQETLAESNHGGNRLSKKPQKKTGDSMIVFRKFARKAMLVMFTLVLPLLVVGLSCFAQETQPSFREQFLGSESSVTAPEPANSSQPPAADSSSQDNGWHFSVSPYLWFPALRGTLGVRGHDLIADASAIDLISHFRFGLMGAVEARHKRLLLPLDLVWVRLGDDKALPFPNLEVNTASVKINQLILAPKVGYRLLDHEKFKADALAGFRFWHLGENLRFSPSRTGLNFSGSQDWVDPVVGGRIQLALSSKIVATVLGDVGGWGATSQLEYQIVGLLGYRIKPNVTLQAGYRYLNVDYRTNGGLTVVNVTMPGIMVGATINLK
jgi:hypothetical protein